MANEYRIILIDEENGDLLTNQLIDEEVAERMAAIVECGFEGEGSECERVCSQVASMLEDAGIDTDNHDEMIEELEDMVLVKKSRKPEKKIEKYEKKPEKKVEKPKRRIVVRRVK